MPKLKMQLTIYDNNDQYCGILHPIHSMRMIGADGCKTCAGIDDFHDDKCSINKKNKQRLLAGKKKLNAQSGSRAKATGEVKPHRGNRGMGQTAAMRKSAWTMGAAAGSKTGSTAGASTSTDNGA